MSYQSFTTECREVGESADIEVQSDDGACTKLLLLFLFDQETELSLIGELSENTSTTSSNLPLCFNTST